MGTKSHAQLILALPLVTYWSKSVLRGPLKVSCLIWVRVTSQGQLPHLSEASPLKVSCLIWVRRHLLRRGTAPNEWDSCKHWNAHEILVTCDQGRTFCKIADSSIVFLVHSLKLELGMLLWFCVGVASELLWFCMGVAMYIQEIRGNPCEQLC